LVDKYNLSSLKYLLIAAAPLSPELATRLKNRLDTTKGTVDVKILEGLFNLSADFGAPVFI
jgi:acyl-coenzyme A synthetase/AMP-(fatty) acid ligase